MHVLKMCFNPKVLAVLALVAVWLFVFQPDVALAALPFLIAVACPLSMIVMARMMGRNQHQAVAAAPGGAQQHYTCPMHSQVVRTAPGGCPVCGMALVPAAAAAPVAAPQDIPPSRAERLAQLQTQLQQMQAQQKTILEEIGRLQAAGTPAVPVVETEAEPVAQSAERSGPA